MSYHMANGFSFYITKRVSCAHTIATCYINNDTIISDTNTNSQTFKYDHHNILNYMHSSCTCVLLTARLMHVRQ